MYIAAVCNASDKGGSSGDQELNHSTLLVDHSSKRMLDVAAS